MDAEEASRLLIRDYSRMARVYDRDVAPHHAPIARRLVELASVKEGARVLDIGCGTGVAALKAATAVGPNGSVAGIDLAEEAIRLAAGKAKVMGLSHVRFEMMDARDLRFPDGSFDAALSCFGHPAVGRTSCFAEVRRVLRPGGSFCLSAWNPSKPSTMPFRELLERRRPPVLARDIAQLVEARKVIASTDEGRDIQTAEGWMNLLGKAGFTRVQVFEETHRAVFSSPDASLDYSFAWGDNERELREMTPEGRASMWSEFRDRVKPMMTEEGLVVDWHLRYFLVRA
jgi:ubiquinone/menaquinone biosynthesis C-methylase UbiE